jgi:hypothetical protein
VANILRVGQHLRARQPVEQRRLSGVGGSNKSDSRQRNRLPLLTLRGASAAHPVQRPVDRRDPLMNPPPVRFELRFTRPSGPDATAEPRHRRAMPCQPRQQVIQLCQFHLQLAFARPRPARENIQDQLRPVQDFTIQLFFQIALLCGRQFTVENNRGRFVVEDLRLQFLHFSGTDERSRIDLRTGLNLPLDHARACRHGQRGELFHRILCADEPCSSSSPAGQMQADQDCDFFACGHYSESVTGTPGAA